MRYRRRLGRRRRFRVLAEGRTLLNDLRDQLLGLSTSRPIPDRHHAHLMLAHQVLQVNLRLRPPILRRMGMNHPLLKHRPVSVEHRHLATRPEPRIDRQHRLVQDRRLKQQTPQIAREHIHRVPLRHLRQIPADFPLHARQQQPVDRVRRRCPEKVAVRVIPQRKLRIRSLLQVGPRHLKLHLERTFLVPPIDRQHPVRRDMSNRLRVFEVVAILEPLAIGNLSLGRDDLTGLPNHPSHRVTHHRQLADRLRQNVPNPFEHLLDGLDVFLGVHKLLRRGVQVRQRLVPVPDPQRQRLEPLVARLRSLRLLLRFERKIQVFQPLGIVRRADRRRQLFRQLALRLDRLEDRFLALRQFAQPSHPKLDLADRHLVQIAGSLLAVTSDEGHRVAFVKQLNDALHLHAPNLQILRDPAQVDLNRGVHEAIYL